MKKLLLSVLLATVMFGGAAVEVTASANAKTEHTTKHHAKKRAVKKHAKKVVKKHVAKKTTKKKARKVAKKRVKKRVVKNTDTHPSNPLAANNKQVPLPKDTPYVGYVYTYGRGFNSAKNIGRVSPYLKFVIVREPGMSDAEYAKLVKFEKWSHELDVESAKQGNHSAYANGWKTAEGSADLVNNDISIDKWHIRSDFAAYKQAVEKYGWKLTRNDWGM